MTQKNKELLLKDLCARLPYRVKCYLIDLDCTKVIGSIQHLGTHQPLVDVFDEDNNEYETLCISELKPYLFPLSSMTEEQKKELRQMDAFINSFGNICFAMYDEYGHDIIPTYEDAIRITNWLNKNHFDYRGLIPMDLAIDATGLNIY